MKALLHFFAFTLLWSLSSPATSQSISLLKDLKSEWKVYQSEGFVPFHEKSGKANTVYFWVDAAQYSGTRLQVSSTNPVSLFVNGQLAAQHQTGLLLKIDSLGKVFHAPVLQISIYQYNIQEGGLETTLVSVGKRSSADLLPLHFASFRDFAVIGMIVLLVILIIIIQLNPKLASDYFSITKIFSMREGEDSQVYSRITSSINVLFYAYSSLILGYYLVIIFHFIPQHYSVALPFQAVTFWQAVGQWLQLSLIILGLFFLKIVMVYGISLVFGMNEVGGIHFFNWVRLLLGVFGVLSIVLFLYFITHGHREGFYIFLLRVMSWLLAGWTILIILKLRRYSGHTMFHLFSYICATELIPFLITIKVLYN